MLMAQSTLILPEICWFYVRDDGLKVNDARMYRKDKRDDDDGEQDYRPNNIHDLTAQPKYYSRPHR